MSDAWSEKRKALLAMRDEPTYERQSAMIDAYASALADGEEAAAILEWIERNHASIYWWARGAFEAAWVDGKRVLGCEAPTLRAAVLAAMAEKEKR